MQGRVFVELHSFREIPGFLRIYIGIFRAFPPFSVGSLLVIQTESMNVLRGSGFYGQRVINSQSK